jgi:transcriptional regulator with XRE-family HTH domain
MAVWDMPSWVRIRLNGGSGELRGFFTMTNSIAVVDPLQALQQLFYSLRAYDLPLASQPHRLPGMTGRAKPYVVNEDSPLTKEQQADAQRLKSAFVSWQRLMEATGRESSEYSQKAIADQLGITQGALSQFLNAHTPLHSALLLRLSKLIGVTPGLISPSLAEKAREEAVAWGFDKIAQIPESASGSSLRKTTTQKGKSIRRQRG